MVCEIVELPLNERVSLDVESLELLEANVGLFASQGIVGRATKEMNGRLAQIRTAYREEDFEMLERLVKSLRRIADQIGLLGVANVADDVLKCMDAKNMQALPAVLARLSRTGVCSIDAVVDCSMMAT